MDEEDKEGTVKAGSEPPLSHTKELTNEVSLHSKVSLNSIIGLSNPKTKKLRGLLGNTDVVVMIDHGATHNFVSLAKLVELNIPVTKSGRFDGSLGNKE